jgi:hypothetical protein
VEQALLPAALLASADPSPKNYGSPKAPISQPDSSTKHHLDLQPAIATNKKVCHRDEQPVS